MTYRLAAADDADQLAELLWDFKNEDITSDPSIGPEYIRSCSEHINQRLGTDLFCWVADDGGRIIAHVFIIITRKLPKPGVPNPVWGRLSNVQTVPEHRNRGIGGALMERVINWCRRRGLEELVVWPSERSVPFYERSGFKGENDVMELLFN
jgi:GNAT superfamily N-acetyltransferase